jgi:hypothetical protein
LFGGQAVFLVFALQFRQGLIAKRRDELVSSERKAGDSVAPSDQDNQSSPR